MAIMLPEDEKDSLSLFHLSLIFSFTFSAFIAVIIFLFSAEISDFFNNQELNFWLYFLPFSIFFAGIFQTFNYWLNRNKDYKNIAMGKIVLGAGTSIFQLLMRIISKISGGLIVGYLIGQIIVTYYFLIKIFKKNLSKFSQINKKRVISNAFEYKKFPLISSFTSILDKSAVQMPILLLSKFFDQTSTGTFSALTRFLDAPFALLNSSIALVLHQRVVVVSRESPEDLYKLILIMYLSLLGFTLPLIILVFFFGSEIFNILLGSSWGDVGEISFFLMVVVGYRFCVSPLSSVLNLKDTLHLGALWQIIYFFTISITLFLARDLSFKDFIFIFMVHEVTLYTLYLCFILYGCRHKNR